MNDNTTEQPSGTSSGGVRWILRAEGLALLIVTCAAYAHWGTLGWGWFAALFLLPDLACLGYALNARIGAMSYNTTHSTLGPAALLLLGLYVESGTCLSIALVWAAHIGFDRALGYGLKHRQGFRWTHLGKIGKDRTQ